MLTSARISSFKENPGMGWVTALRTGDIRKLVNSGALQLSLFDEVNLAEIQSPDFPGERLVACFNPLCVFRTNPITDSSDVDHRFQ